MSGRTPLFGRVQQPKPTAEQLKKEREEENLRLTTVYRPLSPPPDDATTAEGVKLGVVSDVDARLGRHQSMRLGRYASSWKNQKPFPGQPVDVDELYAGEKQWLDIEFRNECGRRRIKPKPALGRGCTHRYWTSRVLPGRRGVLHGRVARAPRPPPPPPPSPPLPGNENSGDRNPALQVTERYVANFLRGEADEDGNYPNAVTLTPSQLAEFTQRVAIAMSSSSPGLTLDERARLILEALPREPQLNKSPAPLQNTSSSRKSQSPGTQTKVSKPDGENPGTIGPDQQIPRTAADINQFVTNFLLGPRDEDGHYPAKVDLSRVLTAGLRQQVTAFISSSSSDLTRKTLDHHVLQLLDAIVRPQLNESKSDENSSNEIRRDTTKGTGPSPVTSDSESEPENGTQPEKKERTVEDEVLIIFQMAGLSLLDVSQEWLADLRGQLLSVQNDGQQFTRDYALQLANAAKAEVAKYTQELDKRYPMEPTQEFLEFGMLVLAKAGVVNQESIPDEIFAVLLNLFSGWKGALDAARAAAGAPDTEAQVTIDNIVALIRGNSKSKTAPEERQLVWVSDEHGVLQLAPAFRALRSPSGQKYRIAGHTELTRVRVQGDWRRDHKLRYAAADPEDRSSDLVSTAQPADGAATTPGMPLVGTRRPGRSRAAMPEVPRFPAPGERFLTASANNGIQLTDEQIRAGGGKTLNNATDPLPPLDANNEKLLQKALLLLRPALVEGGQASLGDAINSVPQASSQVAELIQAIRSAQEVAEQDRAMTKEELRPMMIPLVRIMQAGRRAEREAAGDTSVAGFVNEYGYGATEETDKILRRLEKVLLKPPQHVPFLAALLAGLDPGSQQYSSSTQSQGGSKTGNGNKTSDAPPRPATPNNSQANEGQQGPTPPYTPGKTTSQSLLSTKNDAQTAQLYPTDPAFSAPEHLNPPFRDLPDGRPGDRDYGLKAPSREQVVSRRRQEASNRRAERLQAEIKRLRAAGGTTATTTTAGAAFSGGEVTVASQANVTTAAGQQPFGARRESSTPSPTATTTVAAKRARVSPRVTKAKKASVVAAKKPSSAAARKRNVSFGPLPTEAELGRKPGSGLMRTRSGLAYGGPGLAPGYWVDDSDEDEDMD